MIVPIYLLVVCIASLLGTDIVRRYAISRQVLDVPNDRSSHSVPTPRGGGVAIVGAFLGGTAVLAVLRLIPLPLATAIIGGGGIIAAVGFVDDHRHIAARWRLLAHFAAAAWALAWLGGLPPLQLLAGTVDLGWFGDLLAVVGLVWLLNLYNFMDGIDGIAGVEALTACVGAAALCLASPAGCEWVLPGMLGAAVLGFLVWNFPPASIFMGDAGSGFLGLMLGILALRAGTVAPEWLWSWVILLGVFVVDATVTLLRRLATRQKVYQAHRSHAYQHAAIRAGAHRPVTLAAVAINVLWLFPLAMLVGARHLSGPVGAIIAYAPLAWLAIKLEAGTSGRS